MCTLAARIINGNKILKKKNIVISWNKINVSWNQNNIYLKNGTFLIFIFVFIVILVY